MPSLSPKLDAQKATLKKMSEALKKSGDVQSAAVIEQKLILLDQRDEAGFVDLAKTLASMGKKDEAKDVLLTGVEVVPGSDKIKIELARTYLNEFDQKPALEVLEKVKNKESKEYYSMMGVASDLEGDNMQAKEYYRKGLEVDAKDENLRNNLAMSYILTGEYADAIALLEDLTKDPYVEQKYKPKYRQNLALAYGLSGKNEKALKSLEKDLSPGQARENVEFYKRLSMGDAPKTGKKAAVKPAAAKKEAIKQAEPVVMDKPQAAATPVVESKIIAQPAGKTNLRKADSAVKSTKSYLGQ